VTRGVHGYGHEIFPSAGSSRPWTLSWFDDRIDICPGHVLE
jgi:hypothetical protein